MRAVRSGLLGLALAALPLTVGGQQTRSDQGRSQGRPEPNKQACHGWAVAQSGFDPARPQPSTRPEGGSSGRGPGSAEQDRALAEQRKAQVNSYNRALRNCLRGRGASGN